MFISSPSTASENSWFYFGSFVEVDAPFLKPICSDVIEFGGNNLSYCADCQSLCGVTSLCGMYHVTKHDLHLVLVDDTKPYHGRLFPGCKFSLALTFLLKL